MTLSPFDFVKSINSKQELEFNDDNSRAYNPFIINRNMSFFNDTILFANEMNINHHLPNDIQYKFLFHSINKGKRFSKWFKPVVEDKEQIVMKYYKVNRSVAKEYLNILTDGQLKELKEKLVKGGKSKHYI